MLQFDICDLFPSLEPSPSILIAIVCTEDASRRSEIPSSITVHTYTYSLVAVPENQLCNLAFRYGGAFTGWWHISFPSFDCRKDDSKVIDNFNRNWNVFSYVSDTTFVGRDHSLQFFGGQNVFKCAKHLIRLSVDVTTSSFICRVERCTGKAAWRCPVDRCSSSLCKRHFKILSQLHDEQFIDPLPSGSSSVVENLPPEEIAHSDNESTNSFFSNDEDDSSVSFVGILESGLHFEPAAETEAS